MSTESYHVINVAAFAGMGWDKKPSYAHFFRVQVQDSQGQAKVNEVAASIRKNYPEPDFVVELTRWKCVGTMVNLP